MHPPPPGDDRRLQVLAAVALPPRSATPTLLVEVLLEALHEAVLPHLDPSVTAWDQTSVRTADDLEGRSPGRSVHDGDLTTAVESLRPNALDEPLLLEDTTLTAHRPDRSTDPETSWNDELVAHLDLREATVTISVPQDLLRDHDASPVARGFAAWIQRTAREHHALTGYVTLDEHVSAWNQVSAWEIAVHATSRQRDLTRTLWGHGWGTLLRPAHLAAFGGLPWLHSLLTVVAPGGTATENPDGSVWLQLGHDVRTTSWQDVATLRGLLRPALLTGERTIEEYYSPAPGTWVATPYRL